MNQAIHFLLLLNLLNIKQVLHEILSYEVELILTWSKNSVLADMTERDAGNNDDLPAIVAPTELKFKIKDTKFYVPVVTLSKENDIILLEQLKSGFKRTIKGINTDRK